MSSRSGLYFGLISILGGLASNATAASFHYVDLNSTNPISPFMDWSTAATNIQPAVDAASAGDTVVVADGVYDSVIVNRSIQLRSINGPESTIIEGSSTGSVARALELPSACVVDGFNLRAGGLSSEPSGIRVSYSGGLGAAALVTVTNCIISGNKGGGVYLPNVFYPTGTVLLVNCVISNNAGPGVFGRLRSQCILTNCVLRENSGIGAVSATLLQCVVAGNLQGGITNCVGISSTISNNIGRGAIGSSLYRCLIMGNYCTNFNGAGIVEGYTENSLIISNRAAGTSVGGAVYSMTSGSSRLVNCTIAYNSTANGPCMLTYPFLINCIIWKNFGSGNSEIIYIDPHSCRTPGGGPTCFTNDPLFIDSENGNFQLQPNSPCINAGRNWAMTNSLDFSGNPRVVGGTVDVGAYEYQTPSSVLSYIWAQTNGLPTDGTADYADTDGDGMNNFQECRAGTIPTNPLSVLLLQPPTSTNWTRAVNLTWRSTPDSFYSLERNAALANGTFTILRSNIFGFSYSGTATFTDTNVSSGGPYFYRVGVQ